MEIARGVSNVQGKMCGSRAGGQHGTATHPADGHAHDDEIAITVTLH